MKLNTMFKLIPAVAVVALVGCATGPKPAHFGEPMKLSGAATVSVSKVIAEPASYDGKFIRVEGEVSSVCASKGCWLRMGDPKSADTLFVKFTCPIEGRLIPMDAVGKTAVVEGTLKVEQMTEEDARHYAEDSGKSAEEIAKIVGPQKSLRMASPAAQVVGLDAAAKSGT